MSSPEKPPSVKAARATSGVAGQLLLIPEVVELDEPGGVERDLGVVAHLLEELGLVAGLAEDVGGAVHDDAAPIEDAFHLVYLQSHPRVVLQRLDLRARRRAKDERATVARERGMWRFRSFLPLMPGEQPVSLGEGDTPLLPVPRIGERIGLPRLLVKDEALNPTGSFKARGLAAAITRAVLLGRDPGLSIPLLPD